MAIFEVCAEDAETRRVDVQDVCMYYFFAVIIGYNANETTSSSPSPSPRPSCRQGLNSINAI